MIRVPTRAWRLVVVLSLVAVLLELPASAANAGGPIQPPGLDHFKCYRGTNVTGDPFEFPRGRMVELSDQFGTRRFTLGQRPNRLCNPVNKVLPDGQQFPPANPDAHLVCFPLQEPDFVAREVNVQNQFGTARMTVIRPTRLCAPSWKNFTGEFPPPEQPPGLDHFLCYAAQYSTLVPDRFESVPPFVTLVDQFGQSQNQIGQPNELCNPVRKRIRDHIVPITNPDAHLVCFKTSNPFNPVAPVVKNQFGIARMNVTMVQALCLPSFKQEVPPGARAT